MKYYRHHQLLLHIACVYEEYALLDAIISQNLSAVCICSNKKEFI